MPPPVDMTLPTAVKRPGVSYLAAVLLAIIGLLFAVIAVVDLVEPVSWTGTEEALITGAVYKGVMFLVAVVAAIMVVVGLDFGRVLGAGVAGAAMWLASNAWVSVLAILMNGGFNTLPFEFFLLFLPPILAGFFGVAALLVLAAPSFSQWSVDRRKARS